MVGGDKKALRHFFCKKMAKVAVRLRPCGLRRDKPGVWLVQFLFCASLTWRQAALIFLFAMLYYSQYFM